MTESLRFANVFVNISDVIGFGQRTVGKNGDRLKLAEPVGQSPADFRSGVHIAIGEVHEGQVGAQQFAGCAFFGFPGGGDFPIRRRESRTLPFVSALALGEAKDLQPIPLLQQGGRSSKAEGHVVRVCDHKGDGGQ